VEHVVQEVVQQDEHGPQTQNAVRRCSMVRNPWTIISTMLLLAMLLFAVAAICDKVKQH
jgi:hypothetical protein